MRVPRIYVDQELKPGVTLELPPDTGHYLSRVLRLPVDAVVHLFNGRGGECEATLTSISKNKVIAHLGEWQQNNKQSPLHIELAIGISRGERMDWIIQKSTELGVAGLSPLFTQRCEVKLEGSRLEKKINHWQKIAISACEQSGRNILPVLRQPRRLDQWLAETDSDLKLILDPHDRQPLPTGHQPNSVSLLIGPEGGFTDGETDNARNSGFKSIQLGPRVLRTETAPLAAISILQYQWGDLGGASS